MAGVARPTLLTGLALATRALGPGSTDAPVAADPLRLDLPALSPGSGDMPAPATVRVLGSLYLGAELEQAGIVPIAELLAQQRDTLNLTSYESAARLDEFDTRSREWYDRAGRTQLYARLFGIGPSATNDAGTLANRDFVPLLAGLCHTLVSYGRSSAGADTELDAAVREASEALLGNLEPRGLANTVLAARRIEDQIRSAVDILRDPAIDALVGAHTLQGAVINILGKDAPDVQRLIDCGLAGQKVLDWLASVIPAISGAGARLVTPAVPVIAEAERWLQASGVDTSTPQTASPGGTVLDPAMPKAA
jgi:hypothetical protein